MKPKVGIFGLTGCAGDQLVIVNCEDELLELAGALDIRDFLMASSAHDEGELDLALVEGAVLTKRDEETLKRIRERSKALMALGTCAVWGGVAAMGGNGDRPKLLADVYGEMGARYDSVPAKPLSDYVKVDLKLTGCPIEKHEFLGAVANLLNGDVPLLPSYPLCTECRMRENNCLMIERGQTCCGPLTVAGCAARCPGLGIPCVGCRGPATDANVESAVALFGERGIPREQIEAKLRTFAPVGGRS